LPLAHVGGLAVVTRSLVTGTPLTVLDRFDADAVMAAARAGCTHVSLVPTTLARIDPGGFERIIVGGAAPPADLPTNCSITYGLTETGSGCVYDHLPLNGVEVRVVDGEIQLRGPMLLRAYRSADGEWSPLLEGGWFPTGDQGAWDPERGWLDVFGRRGDLIITGGQNVWPDPVEAVLARVAGVAEVAVVGRPDAEWGHAVTAVVVPTDPAAPPSLAALRAAVQAELAPYCAPRAIEVVTALPRTALGKVQRNRL
jgi:O-succinylbenzoic acid--CoA ligase